MDVNKRHRRHRDTPGAVHFRHTECGQVSSRKPPAPPPRSPKLLAIMQLASGIDCTQGIRGRRYKTMQCCPRHRECLNGFEPFSALQRFLFIACVIAGIGACNRQANETGTSDLVWGRPGFGDGRFQRPRAIAIDPRDQLFIVDMTGRIQVFTAEGEFLRSWRTPEIKHGKPTGLSFDNEGNLMVADTHYFRILFYTPEGVLLDKKTIGGTNGRGPGEFNFVTKAVQDSHGNFYISEYGEYDRIQKFSPERKFLMEWGGHGQEPGHFMRPQSLALDQQDRLFVADACNHRIQIFDATGDEPKFLGMWGEHGSEPGQLSYPYGMILDGENDMYVCEYGNHRVQKFSRDGKLLAQWGRAGRGEGELNQPWSLIKDSQGRVHVLDSYNHRVQRIRL